MAFLGMAGPRRYLDVGDLIVGVDRRPAWAWTTMASYITSYKRQISGG